MALTLPDGAHADDEMRPVLRRAILTLMVTQIVGWGTTFHVAAILHARIAEGVGLPSALVFGGITLMLLVAAALSPKAGRLLERDGARRWMIVGSGLLALGLSILSVAHGPVLFVLAWIVFGIAMPFALNQGASTAVVQIAPDRARRAVALLLLVAGLSATIVWPILIWLDGGIGWRGALVVCVAANLLVCMPLHAVGLPRARRWAPAGSSAPVARQPPPPRIAGAYPLAAISLSLAGVLTWGLPLHMVAILSEFGHDEGSAVLIGGLFGPGQVLARAFDMLGGHRVDILKVGVGAMLLMAASLVWLLLEGRSEAGAVLYALGYGISAGILSIVRAITPLRLFGPKAYAEVLGRLGVPQNAAFASAPLGFAIILERWGVDTLVILSLALALVGLAASALLAVRASRAERSG